MSENRRSRNGTEILIEPSTETIIGGRVHLRMEKRRTREMEVERENGTRFRFELDIHIDGSEKSEGMDEFDSLGEDRKTGLSMDDMGSEQIERGRDLF